MTFKEISIIFGWWLMVMAALALTGMFVFWLFVSLVQMGG
jgi:hypothetical protein